jgi:RNA polymerase sigma factor (sigma-70 family)
MHQLDDGTLLRQFVENHSDEAFAALVTSHVNLVYSVALRYVGNPHDTEEITQAVFIILAKRAARLREVKALSSWLFQTTRLTANNFVRSEIRRHRREQEAHMESILNESETAVWLRIAPLLDTAVAGLREKERQAIVLRFYEGKNLRDIGTVLGTSEDAAEKRVSRSLEKLRKFFTKRGVTLSSVAIAGVISANSVQAAPVGLAATISATAAKGTVVGGSTLTLVKGALKIMAWTKMKTGIVVGTTAIALALGTGYFGFFYHSHQQHQTSNLKIPAGSVTPAIGFGRNFGVILASDGSLWVWGENSLGWPNLGLGKINHQPFLRRIGNENDWAGIAVGDSHVLALKSNGSILGWGQNIYDELGTHPDFLRSKMQGLNNTDSPGTPIQSVLGQDWTQLAAGESDSFGIKGDGSLWAWGLNDFGQLGIGNFKDSPIPVQVGSATWKKVCAGFINTAGLQSDGSLWVWGGGPTVGNTFARNAKNYSIPMCISTETNWGDVTVGFNVVFAVKSDGTLWAWGYEAGLYTGGNSNSIALTQIGSDNDWQACFCSGNHYLVLQKKNGSLWCVDSIDTRKPALWKQVGIQKDFIAIGGGSGLGAALTRNGEVWTWGKVIGENVTEFSEFSGSGKNIQVNEPTYTFLDKPWQLSNSDPNSQTK